jgi:hypothetical protein
VWKPHHRGSTVERFTFLLAARPAYPLFGCGLRLRWDLRG